MELYQVKYQTLGKDLSEEYSLEDLSEGNLVLTEVDNQMVEGRIKYLGYNWSPWTESQQTKVSVACSLLPSDSLFLHCEVSEGPADRGEQGVAASRGDCRPGGGGHPRHGHRLLHCEEEEKVTKQI